MGKIKQPTNSTYWMRDGRYIRLKNLDIGYTLPKSIVNKLHFNNIRIYIWQDQI